jgi:hypothetical protein
MVDVFDPQVGRQLVFLVGNHIQRALWVALAQNCRVI